MENIKMGIGIFSQASAIMRSAVSNSSMMSGLLTDERYKARIS